MRQVIVAAVAAFVVGGAATGAVLSQAQPERAAVPMTGSTQAMPNPLGMHRMGMNEMGHHGRPFDPRQFALVYRQPDRQLTPPDVQKIAEAFLLWNGNHSWKVADVAAEQDGAIAFSLTTAEGSPVAKFSMDPHTGRLRRIG